MLSGVLLTSCAHQPPSPSESPLRGKIICVDPGHGGTAQTDSFRVGPTGEREEGIDLRVALLLQRMLEDRGAQVVLTRTEDRAVGLKDRAQLAVGAKADVFLSIHHNATADRTVNFPIIYYHANASENQASVQLAKCLGRRLAEALYSSPPPVNVVSDHTIFPGSGAAVLRESYGIPGVIGEASFFSNAEEEIRLRDPAHNRKEAGAYARALEDFLSAPRPPILERYSTGRIPPLPTLQESERMDEAAKRWRQDYAEAMDLSQLQPAYDLFSRSARSFPDSPVARDCHVHRADILQKLGKPEEAAMEQRRVQEYYVPLENPDR